MIRDKDSLSDYQFMAPERENPEEMAPALG